MTDENLTIRPVSQEDSFWLDSFRQEYIKEAERYDDLAKELFKLELAIPGLYAIGLKLFGEKVALDKIGLLLAILAFVCWLAALGFTLRGLFPKKYSVMEGVPKKIQKFFRDSTRYKKRCLQGGVAFFFLGIFCVVISLFHRI